MANDLHAYRVEITSEDGQSLGLVGGGRLALGGDPVAWTLSSAGGDGPAGTAVVLRYGDRPVVRDGGGFRLGAEDELGATFRLRNATEHGVESFELLALPEARPLVRDPASGALGVGGGAGGAHHFFRLTRLPIEAPAVEGLDPTNPWTLLPAGVNAQELAEQYAPAVRLHVEEQWFPSSVDYFLSGSELRGPGVPAIRSPTPRQLAEVSNHVPKYDPDLRLYLNPSFRRGEGERIGTANPPPIYVTLRRVSPVIYDLVYWTFYPYNACPKFGACAGWSHDGDWEHFTVRLFYLGSLVPWLTLGVFGSAHGGGVWKLNGETLDGTSRLVCYAAINTHAVYLDNGNAAPDGEGRHRHKGLPSDWTHSRGRVWETWRSVVRVAWSPTVPTLNNQDWINFTGRWGADPHSPSAPAVKDSYPSDPGGPTGSPIFGRLELTPRGGPVNVRTQDGYAYAGVSGSVVAFQRDSSSFASYTANLPEEARDEEVRIDLRDDVIWAGANGYVYRVRTSKGTGPIRLSLLPPSINLPGRNGVTNVLVHDGRVFAGAGGQAFELDAGGAGVRWHNELPGPGPREVRFHVYDDVLWTAVDGWLFKLSLAEEARLGTIARMQLKNGRSELSGVTSILTSPHHGQVWAAAEGLVFAVDPVSLATSAPISPRDIDDGEVRLTLADDLLLAGIDGHVVTIDRATFTRRNTLHLEDRDGVTETIFVDGTVFAGPEGRVYQLDQQAGRIIASNRLEGIGDAPVSLASLDGLLLVGSSGYFWAIFKA